MNMRFLPLLIFLGACGGSDHYRHPEQKPLMEAVYASGFVVSKNEYQAYAQTDGYVTEIVATEGSLVKRGDIIFVIESQQQSARNQMAREAFDMAQRNQMRNSPVLTEAEAAMRSATIKAKYDSVNLARYTNLLKQNATTRAEYDRIKLLAESSHNEWVLQQSRFAKLKDQLSLELANARNQYKISAEESGRYAIRSEMDGKVYKVLKERGELARRNEAVAVVGSKDAFYLQLSVDEMDIRKVQAGQLAYVKIDAFAGRHFEARITSVHPLVDSRQQSVRVDADFTEVLPAAFSGLSVEANIVIRQKDKALVLPKSALEPGDSVVVKGKKEKIKIVRGIETLDEVEILEGLKADDLVRVKQ